MEIEQLRNKALNQCIDIANDFTKEEVEKFMPLSVQKAWEIGDNYLKIALKEARSNRKGLVL